MSHDHDPVNSHLKTNHCVCNLVLQNDIRGAQILDVGAGKGFFSQLLGDHIETHYHVSPSGILKACDLFPENFKYPSIACDKVNLDGNLPYADDAFDVACSIEVIEHLENPFALVRELYRIVKPGGRAIITTPNILNINSRLKYLYSGFWLLYGPLPLQGADCVTLEGHINPMSFYYLAAALRKTGFRDVRLHFDRTKKSGLALGLLFYPLLRVLHAANSAKIRQKTPQIYQENQQLLANINSIRMLSSRTIVVEAVK